MRELLTIEGVSLWDAMTVEMALFHVPAGLAGPSGRRTLRQLLTPYLRPIKYAFWKPAAVNTDDCARWPSGPAALFIGFSPYMQRDVLQPVVDMLLREPGLTPVGLDAEASCGAIDPLRHTVHCHRSKATVREARQFAKAARRASAILTGDERYRRLFVDGRRPLWSLLKHGVRRAFGVTASYFLPDTVAIAKHILTVHRPAVIVSIDAADPRTRVYSLLGAALGIPTVQIQSGNYGQEAVEWRFLLDDVLAVQGNYSRDVFLSHGVPAERMAVTGSPRFDALRNASASEVDEFRARFGIPAQNRIVVFASSYFLDIHSNQLADTACLLRAMKQAIFAAVAATANVSLVVKPHPLEDIAETRALVVDHANVAFAAADDDIRKLTCACDAFLSMGSSVTMDALILGKPTICPAFPGWNFSNLYIRTGAVMAPSSASEVLAAIREIAAGGGAEIARYHAARRSEYLAAVVRDEGRGGTRRIVELLKELTGVAAAENTWKVKRQQ